MYFYIYSLYWIAAVDLFLNVKFNLFLKQALILLHNIMHLTLNIKRSHIHHPFELWTQIIH